MISRRGFLGAVGMGIGAALLPISGRADDRNVVCSVIEDVETGAALVRQGPCERRFSPCSTFKFPLAAMGFDTGFLVDPQQPLIDYRSEIGASERERKATDPTIWLRDSIIWYSRHVTKQLGRQRLQRYVDAWNYGNRDFSGTPGKDDGLTQAWLMSSLRISPDEQVRFIRAFLRRELGITAAAYDNTAAALPVFQSAGGWTVHGKTGSGWLGDTPDTIEESRPQGWFVGWAERGGRRLAFARIEVGNQATPPLTGAVVRTAVLAQLDALGR
ncbi:MAG TPA: class D beta-lactamase [Magnetospirillum sp.]|nr:class D beta-lactamase [Magnetospirillum sp.]